MKQIRKKVARLDIHCDSVAACCRIEGSSGIETSKETFPREPNGSQITEPPKPQSVLSMRLKGAAAGMGTVPLS